MSDSETKKMDQQTSGSKKPLESHLLDPVFKPGSLVRYVHNEFSTWAITIDNRNADSELFFQDDGGSEVLKIAPGTLLLYVETVSIDQNIFLFGKKKKKKEKEKKEKPSAGTSFPSSFPGFTRRKEVMAKILGMSHHGGDIVFHKFIFGEKVIALPDILSNFPKNFKQETP